MLISDISIRRPVTTLTSMAALVVFGVLAFRGIGIDLFPEVDFPFVTVTTTLVGASPEVMEQDVTDVLEEQIKTISGIKSLNSQSFESLSLIRIEFELFKDVNVAAEEVRAKVNLAEKDLPADIEKPIVDKLDIATQPIMWVAVSGNVKYRELAHYADKVVKEEIQSLSGVGNIQMGGLREREIRVWLDPMKMEGYNITAQDIVWAIHNEHVELPGGRIEAELLEYSVKIEGEYTSADSMNNIVIAKSNDTPIYLKDVAKVEDGLEDFRTIARFNGIPTIGLGVRKQSGTNTVEVAEIVKKKLEKIKQQCPEGISIDLAFDSSDFIKSSMKGVQFDIILGIIFTALIMYIFLRNVRITFISVIAIPISLIGAFIVMNALDFTINNMTMLALSLAVGMVIDDAIVVLENIFRHIEKGEERMGAARIGTDEVALAVLAATSSIAAVFIPVAFMKGIIGRFFFQFGLTVALTIIISALVSLTLTPFLCSRILHHKKKHNRFYVVLETFFTGLERGYRRILKWAVSHRLGIVMLTIVVFLLGMSLKYFIGTEFITEADESRFLVRFELPTGTSIQQTDKHLRKVEKIIFNQPEIKGAFTAIGIGSSTEINTGIGVILLVPKNEREFSQAEIMQRLRSIFQQYKDIIFSVENLSPIGGGQRSANIQFVIQGPTIEDLSRVVNEIVQDLKSNDNFMDVDSDLRITKPDVKVYVNRGLANDLGVDVRSISNEIYTLFGGLEAAKFKEGGYRYDIRVKALPNYRMKPSDLYRMTVRGRDGRLVKAPNLINYQVGQGPNVINRYDRRRAVTLFANVSNISEGEGLQELERIVLKTLPKDGNWSTALTGRTRAFQESFKYMLDALIIAILIIYMILAIQFESFIHPFTIMISLPLTMIGVFGALLITGKTLNIFSFIGIIMLMGIVTKNAILLVDFANQQRRRGIGKVEAMLIAGPIRLRPILMTAVSTMMAMVPIALALSEGGETRAPMAVTVIGGMLTSTLLTLLVVPVVYLLLDDVVAWIWERMRSLYEGLTCLF